VFSVRHLCSHTHTAKTVYTEKSRADFPRGARTTSGGVAQHTSYAMATGHLTSPPTSCILPTTHKPVRESTAAARALHTLPLTDDISVLHSTDNQRPEPTTLRRLTFCVAYRCLRASYGARQQQQREGTGSNPAVLKKPGLRSSLTCVCTPGTSIRFINGPMDRHTHRQNPREPGSPWLPHPAHLPRLSRPANRPTRYCSRASLSWPTKARTQPITTRERTNRTPRPIHHRKAQRYGDCSNLSNHPHHVSCLFKFRLGLCGVTVGARLGEEKGDGHSSVLPSFR
jgi:hypothetical protein